MAALKSSAKLSYSIVTAICAAPNATARVEQWADYRRLSKDEAREAFEVKDDAKRRRRRRVREA